MNDDRRERSRARIISALLRAQRSPASGVFGDYFADAGIRRVLRNTGTDPQNVESTLERHRRFTPVASANPQYRAWYLLNAARRADRVKDSTERRYFTQHVQADYDRIFAAQRIKAARDSYGALLGWYAKEDDRVTAECRYADGKNFDPTSPPPWGLPGIGTHHGCRCVPGPPHAQGEVMDRRTALVHEHSATPQRVIDLRWNPLQPRWPSGTGKGGQWRDQSPGRQGLISRIKTAWDNSKRAGMSDDDLKSALRTTPSGPDRELLQREHLRRHGKKSRIQAPDQKRSKASGVAKPTTGQNADVRARKPKAITTEPKGPDLEAVSDAEADLIKRMQAQSEKRMRDTQERIKDGWNTGKREDVSSHIITADDHDPRVSEAIDEAMRAVDEVHGDGGLPAIYSDDLDGFERHNGEYERAGFGSDVDRITVKPTAPHPELTVTHEIGHFIDQRGMGANEHNFATHQTEYFNNPVLKAMKDFLDTANHSSALMRGGRNVNTNPNYFKYWSSPHEVWARAYAQFIARRSSSQVLKQQLREQQMRDNHSDKNFPQQWSRSDFEPLEAKIEAVLRAQGWLK